MATSTNQCVKCKRFYKKKAPNQKYCSSECSYSSKLVAVMSPIQSKPCTVCGAAMEGRTYMMVRMYCSKRCAHKAEKQQPVVKAKLKYKERCRLLGIEPKYIDPVTVDALMVRDNATCHICKGAVDASLRVPNRFAPTIDHLVPVSQGGAHSWANCMLAHMTCNAGRKESRRTA